jgi:putative acetyltransferase
MGLYKAVRRNLSMDILIRAEEIRDYFRISEIQALAFHREGYIGEIQLVDAQRHGPAYNPQLALVAEVNGEVAGHAFFYPHRIQIGGLILYPPIFETA